MNKNEIRKEILGIRKALNAETVNDLSKHICDKLISIKEIQNCNKICIYMPIRNEADVFLLTEYDDIKSKEIYIPKTFPNGIMEFYRYSGKESLVIGAYQIPEPDINTSEKLIPDNKTVCLMPGSVFSRQYGRIGYGGGYYDRYLEKYSDIFKIGVCYGFQLLPEIPTEDYDICPDIIVTEKEII